MRYIAYAICNIYKMHMRYIAILNGNPKREKITKVVSFINKLFFWFLVPPYAICNIYKTHMRYIALAIYRYIAFAFCKCCISQMPYLTLQNAYAIYCICDTFSRTLALCLGLGYSECTINNAYAFFICTSEVRF